MAMAGRGRSTPAEGESSRLSHARQVRPRDARLVARRIVGDVPMPLRDLGVRGEGAVGTKPAGGASGEPPSTQKRHVFLTKSS